MLLETLKQIGLTEKESKLYIEMLALGMQPVSVLARRIGLNRTTVYSVLKTLRSKGLISSVVRSGVKYFVACDPNALVGYFDQKCRELEYLRASLLSSVEGFRSLSSEESSRPVVRFYDGLESVKCALAELLSADIETGFLCPQAFVCSRLESFFRLVLAQSLFLQDCSLVIPDTDYNRDFCADFDCFPDFVPISSDVQVLLAGSQVAIVNLTKYSEYLVLIDDMSVAKMHLSALKLLRLSCEREDIEL